MNLSPNHKNDQKQSLTNRLLGYPLDARLLIINADEYDFLMSQAAKDVVESEGIILIDYRDLQAVWRGL